MIAASSPRMLSRAGLAGCLLLAASGCAPQPAPPPVTPTVPRATTADATLSVVIVHADGMDLDMAAPWGTGRSWTRVMTGLVVDDQRILVAGWGLRNQQHVHVQKQGATGEVPARVALSDPDSGLTLLAIDDAVFWRGLTPAVLTNAVAAAGPTTLLHAAADGARVERSGGVVAGFRAYGRTHFLELKLGQVDTAHLAVSDVVSSGSEVVGMVIAHESDDVLAVSSALLHDFLAEARRPTYRGYAAFGANWQMLKSPTLREELGLSPAEGGVRITRVNAQGAAAGVLAVGDVIFTVDGKKIDKDGTLDRPGAGRVVFTTALSEGHHPGDVVEFLILRDGVRKSVSVTLAAEPGTGDLVPWWVSTGDVGGTFAIEGGLVFENLSGDYLQTFGKDWDTKAPQNLVRTYWLDHMQGGSDRSRVVVLTRVLADPATLGYRTVKNLVVESINGVHLRSLDDVHAAFAHPAGAFDVVTFAPGQGIHRIVLDAAEARAANERLRATYGAASPGK